MSLELTPRSEPGQRLLEGMAGHYPTLVAGVAKHDRDGTFPFETFEAFQKTGILAATVPVSLGGLGVDSILDLTVAINRLGRIDGSVAIAANMHLALTLVYARVWETTPPSSRSNLAALHQLLRRVGERSVTICCPASEPGTDLVHPATTARRTESGWSLHGRKIFGTLAPIAQLFAVPVRVAQEGEDRIGFAFVPRESPGVTIGTEWNALGMRATGSVDVAFDNCTVPAGYLLDLGAWGTWSPATLSTYAIANTPLLGGFLGIAEAARQHALRAAGRSRGNVAEAVGRIDLELAAMRALLERTCIHLDRYVASGRLVGGSLTDAHTAMQDVQETKWWVNRKAIEVVDLAMQVAGGSGYMEGNPLARLYRDVRAGPFMQPFGPLEAVEYIGRVSLGRI